MRTLDEVAGVFRREFGRGPDRAIFAPGRVNLIGDHIDYSGGLVLPMAIDRGTTLVAGAGIPGRVRCVSLDRAEPAEASLADAEHNPRGWFAYVLGVVHQMQLAGAELPGGLDLALAGDIPDGAGLSSSASLEMAVAVAVNEASGARLTPTELAVLGRRVENDYVGVASGIMDQLAVARGRRGCALLMNCATLDVDYVPFPHDRASIVIANSNHRRSLTDSGYNERRAAAARAAQILGTERLVDLPASAAQDVRLDEDARACVRHTISENARVEAAAQAIRSGDLAAVGTLMRESHESLRDDFRVTGPYLDALAESAWRQPDVIGARMTGAGMGGCAVLLVVPGREEEVMGAVAAEYQSAVGIEADLFVVTSDDGAREVPLAGIDES